MRELESNPCDDRIISNAKIDLIGHGFSSKQAGKKCSK